MSIYVLIMIDYMGLDDFVPTFGATMLVVSIGFFVIGPIPGKDVLRVVRGDCEGSRTLK